MTLNLLTLIIFALLRRNIILMISLHERLSKNAIGVTNHGLHQEEKGALACTIYVVLVEQDRDRGKGIEMAMDVGEWNGNRGWAPSAEDRGRCLGLGRSSLIPCPKKQRTTPQQQEEHLEEEEEEEEDEEGEGGGEEDEEEEGEEGEEEEENAGGGGGGADEEEEGGRGGGGEGEEDDDEDEDEDEEEEEAEAEAEAEEEEASESNGIGCSNSGDCGDRSISVTLTDPDILDCPICCENLSIPVFQCQNGHLACSSCYSKLGSKCPSCSSLVGYYRCRGVENILESVKIPCRNMKYGCKEMVLCCKRPDHEDECPCAPCSCPLLDCNFVGSSENLYIHFSMKHSNSAKSFCYDNRIPISLDKQQKYLILQEQEEGTLFIINNGVEPHGNVINVSCIGIGQSSTSIGYSYYLLVKNGGSSLMLKSYTGFVPAWVEHTPPSRFLVVPSDFVGSCGKLKLELNISGKPF